MAEAKRPKISEQEFDKLNNQFDNQESDLRSMNLDKMNAAPKEEKEANHKLSEKEIAESKDIYLKPTRQIASREKFNEDYRKDYDFKAEYVRFIAENNEIIGENIEIWTKPFAGMPAQEWKVPVNKPVWGPRFLAEQIKKCTYHRLTMQQNVVTGNDERGYGQYYGAMAVDTIKQRLDAHPAYGKKSLFMGATNF